MLEELEHAKKRGARIYAEVVGYGATGDAYHITSPAENGEGAGMAMKLAMEEAGAQPEQIDYINAHGTSTHHNDLYETRAIRYALGAADISCCQFYEIDYRTSSGSSRRGGICYMREKYPGWIHPPDHGNQRDRGRVQSGLCNRRTG